MEQTDIYKVQLGDAAIEVGGDLAITFGKYKMKLPLATLKELKEKGTPSDILSCIGLCFIKNGKTPEEAAEIIQTGFNKGYHLSVAFEAPEGGTLDISTPEKAPVLDKIVQGATSAEIE